MVAQKEAQGEPQVVDSTIHHNRLILAQMNLGGPRWATQEAPNRDAMWLKVAW